MSVSWCPCLAYLALPHVARVRLPALLFLLSASAPDAAGAATRRLQAAGIPCPEGFFCTGLQADKAPCTCSVGYYCPEGSAEAPGVPCPAGFSCPGAPSNGLSNCPAAPGAFCPPGDTDNVPDVCPQVRSPGRP